MSYKIRRCKSHIEGYLDRLGWSRQDLAVFCGVTDEAVRLWIIGQSYPHFYTCFRLSVLFGCSLYDLFDLR